MLFSIVAPITNPELKLFSESVSSIRKQLEVDWELIIVSNNVSNSALEQKIHEFSVDPKIKNIHVPGIEEMAGSLNYALNRTNGEFVIFLDQDDILHEAALQKVRHAIESNDDVDYVYSDEAKIGKKISASDKLIKPDWSPERLRAQMYTGNLSAIRSSLLKEVGAFRSGFEGAYDYDLILRVTEKSRNIIHIPEILYYCRSTIGRFGMAKNYGEQSWEAGARAVQEHCDRVGIAAQIVKSSLPDIYKICREPELKRSTSVIIPTRGSSGEIFNENRVFVVEAVRSLLEHTEHEDLEIVLVYDTETPISVLEELEEIAPGRIKLVLFEEEFNFSRKCNIGAVHSKGDALVFLNDDVQIISSEIIGNLLSPLNEPDVGMTGAMLYFEDGTVQHAGHLYERGGYTHHHLGDESSDPGSFGSMIVNREVSGLTAACIAVNRKDFFDIGGFSETLPGNFNDVDFSLKMGRLGRRLVWLADVKLYHFESKTRIPQVHLSEIINVESRWGRYQKDPFCVK